MTKRKHRRAALTPEARRRMAEAGAANLAKWKARHGPPNQQHGIFAWLARGVITPEIRAQLDEFEAGLIADLGGNLSTAQKALVRSSRVALGVVLLAQHLLESSSVSRGRRARLSGALHTLATYQNSLRLSLRTLGIERRESAAPRVTLQDKLRQLAEQEKETGDEARRN